MSEVANAVAIGAISVVIMLACGCWVIGSQLHDIREELAKLRKGEKD